MTKAKQANGAAAEMTANERQQLIRLVKMKTADVLAEIEQRFADDMAEISTEVARRFIGDDRRLETLAQELDEITEHANRQAAAVFDKYADLVSPSSRRDSYTRPYFSRLDHRREEARRALTATVHATKARARQRAQANQTRLIEELTLGALHSEAARSFVSRMPDAQQLLAEAALERPRQLDGGPHNG